MPLTPNLADLYSSFPPCGGGWGWGVDGFPPGHPPDVGGATPPTPTLPRKGGGSQKSQRVGLIPPELRVDAADGVATVRLAFRGRPANGLSAARLLALDRALSPLLKCPHLDAVVIRSGRAGGFCGGYSADVAADLADDESAARFSRVGQQVFGRLAESGPVTVAFVDGPCVGPGLELALACDVRLAVAGPDSAFGFPLAADGLPPAWGGSARLRRLMGRRTAADLLSGKAVLNGREARRAGLVDDAFSARRAEVELKLWLDRLSANPPERRRPAAAADLAAERAAFRRAVADGRAAEAIRTAAEPSPVFPEVVGLIGATADVHRLAVEAALRGRRVVASGHRADEVERGFAEAVARGRVTPWEADQARGRVSVAGSLADFAAAGLVAVAGDPPTGLERVLKPAAELRVLPAAATPHPTTGRRRAEAAFGPAVPVAGAR